MALNEVQVPRGSRVQVIWEMSAKRSAALAARHATMLFSPHPITNQPEKRHEQRMGFVQGL
jgi:hypothetical protein